MAAKKEKVAEDKSVVDVHIDALISDTTYLLSVLNGIESRLYSWHDVRRVVCLSALIEIMQKRIAERGDNINFLEVSFQWPIDALVGSGINGVHEAIVPAFNRLFIRPALEAAVAREPDVNWALNLDLAYKAVATHLSNYLSRSEAHQIASKFFNQIYDTLATLVILPERGTNDLD